MKYQYHDLSESQFEDLAEAICDELLGIGTQSFSTGPDGGRDARFHGKAQLYPSQQKSWEGLVIIQAKHTFGINKKFSDADFFGNANSVIDKEIPTIKKLVENSQLDYYMLFSNRKLAANINEKIIGRISEEVGLDKDKVALFGVERIEKYIKAFPSISIKVNINPFDSPLIVEPDEFANIILALSAQIHEIKAVPIKDIKRVGFESKNETNNLSEGYANNIKKYVKHFGEIRAFLESPENEEYLNYYSLTAEEFEAKIIVFKGEMHTFDKVLEHLIAMLFSRDGDLAKNKKLTRTMLYYMYFNCDIGTENEALSN